MTDFAKTVAEAYAAKGPALQLGRGVHVGKLAYGTRVDNESARERLAARTAAAAAAAPATPAEAPAPKKEHKEAADAASGGVEAIALERQVMHGVFGMLKKRL